MSAFQTPITVKEAMEKINHREYLIPAFQREYVWDHVRVENLFDSLMREYPINSMLFWQVTKSAYTSFAYYDFLNQYVECHKIHNTATTVTNDFLAVLDGQQRLTSLYLGLFGTYAYHTKYKGWEYTPGNFPQRKLYLNISRVNQNASEDDEMYIFEFLKDEDTNSQDLVEIIGEKWFRVGHIVDLYPNILPFVMGNELTVDETNILNQLMNVICVKGNINYYLETAVQPDQAVNIFVRTNSGGKPLSILDILLSLTIAGWTNVKAKDEFIQLANAVSGFGFSINHEYILKAFLCLFNSSVKNQISSFNTAFLTTSEQHWPKVKDCIISLFELLKSFGLDNTTLKSYNATLPILCYMYWNNKYPKFTTSIANVSDIDTIRKWLLKTILYKSFGASADSILQRSLKHLKNQSQFPAVQVSRDMGQPTVADPAWIDELLSTQKDDPYAFAILSILYPNCNFATTKFDKDHLHPAVYFDQYKNGGGTKRWEDYNSIVNLQLLDATSNRSKNADPLDEWVADTVKTRPNLCAETYIPSGNSLLLSDFDSFYDERKVLLADQIKKVL